MLDSRRVRSPTVLQEVLACGCCPSHTRLFVCCHVLDKPRVSVRWSAATAPAVRHLSITHARMCVATSHRPRGKNKMPRFVTDRAPFVRVRAPVHLQLNNRTNDRPNRRRTNAQAGGRAGGRVGEHERRKKERYSHSQSVHSRFRGASCTYIDVRRRVVACRCVSCACVCACTCECASVTEVNGGAGVSE